jgi:hypothetical protein
MTMGRGYQFIYTGLKCAWHMSTISDRDLLGIDNLSFIKKILVYMHRDDLLKEVCNYEKESAKAADAKPPRPTIPTRPKSGN